ncbi:hypothetical protein B0T19DRAFT_107715 [Cercophora scortea]|uniref:Uncharacterized protein n=1 Tax=Cercophora scortea TaxID=314031 RepID=A0AAE0IWS6_9PEZI|nr:hypothetical protein B0T19DRAFT_107715 [Cercophora scortea]
MPSSSRHLAPNSRFLLFTSPLFQLLACMAIDKKPSAPIRYHAAPACIALLYLTSLLVPWGLTCKLGFNVITPGQNIQSEDVNISGAATQKDQTNSASRTRSLMYAIDASNYVSALASLPAIYALLARAAVVVTQRTKPSRTLNVRQLFDLADRNFLRHMLGSSRSGTWLTWFGAALIILAVALPPIRASLVTTETVVFPIQQAYYGGPFSTLLPYHWVSDFVGLDPSLAQIVKAPQRTVAERTRNDIVNSHTGQYHLSSWYELGQHYASSLPSNTQTGLFRQHALRMGVGDIECSLHDTYKIIVPGPCPGRNPLVLTYNNPNVTGTICVPGDIAGSPWNTTSRDEQGLVESLIMTIVAPVSANRIAYAKKYNVSVDHFTPLAVTVNCTARTRLGYFELGNNYNGGKFGPILNKFPATGEYEFSDGLDGSAGYDKAKIWDDINHSNPDSSPPAPGPLAIVAMALFGNGSFFEQAQHITEYGDALSRALCAQSQIPFQRSMSSSLFLPCDMMETRDDVEQTMSAAGFDYLAGKDADWGWANARLVEMVWHMGNPSFGPTIIGDAMYYANRALLEGAAFQNTTEANEIWHAEGVPVFRPKVSLLALIVVSILLGLQVVGILVLVGFIYSMPTWTDTLDAMAVAKITHQIEDGGVIAAGGLEELNERAWRRLESVDALVGVDERFQMVEEGGGGGADDAASVNSGVTAVEEARDRLRVGAVGLVRRELRQSIKAVGGGSVGRV